MSKSLEEQQFIRGCNEIWSALNRNFPQYEGSEIIVPVEFKLHIVPQFHPSLKLKGREGYAPEMSQSGGDVYMFSYLDRGGKLFPNPQPLGHAASHFAHWRDARFADPDDRKW